MHYKEQPTRVIDWLNRQTAFVKQNNLEDAVMTNDGDLLMTPENPKVCTLVTYDPKLPVI